MRRQISRARSPSSMSRKVTEILEKAEKERDEALNELRRARIDIQNLKDEIKVNYLELTNEWCILVAFGFVIRIQLCHLAHSIIIKARNI